MVRVISTATLFLACTALVFGVYTERECPCTKDDGIGLWLDVAIAIDASAGMSSDSLVMTLGDIVSIFPMTAIGNDTGPAPGQTTRIAISTFDTKSTLRFSLNSFASNNDFMNNIWDISNTNTTSPQSSLKAGLAGALSALTSGRSDGRRKNFRQVIIVYTATCDDTPGDDDPTVIADDIKGSDISIIMVGFDQIGNNKVSICAKKFGSPGMTFSNSDPNLVGEIQQALCQVNCFCASTWANFQSNGKKYGSCTKLGNAPAIWVAAKHACTSLAPTSFLLNEMNIMKHNFITTQVKSETAFKKPHMFYIGMSYVNKKWVWEQENGKPQIPWAQNDTSFGWCPGYPDGTETSGNTCVMEVPSDTLETKFCWQNTRCITAKDYYCQRETCDVQNFCPN